ncbi:hypothetical protein AbraIFM66950_006677 [Aspergillus brasiliensis]|nr:hypothetical protein AbraIFM66950_006677 [Aspergillus brasiliensis]
MHLGKTSYILPFGSLLSSISLSYATSLPIVDLGYELHQAFSLDQSTQAYNFSNIRFAAPPTSNQRFRPPLPPSVNRTHIQTGSVGRVCPQGIPVWSPEITIPFLADVLTGTPFNGSDNVTDYPIVWPPADSRITEDCLFLDVVVPKSVFEGSSGAAPVLVWFTGGGFANGDKTEVLPTGLLERGLETGEDFVYVSVNYRLGAFGWLSDGEGMGNAGLYDQRLALEWVKKYIGLFGGDSDRVTIMGESAGGASVVHQLAAYGGNEREGELPFQQAIIQSPGWYAQSVELQKSSLQQFLDLLNVTSVEEARQLPSDQLIAANAYQIATTSVYGTFTYGPVVDTSFITDFPSRILLNPNFKWKNVRVMTSHTTHEGLSFTPPAGVNSSALPSIIETYVPGLAPGTVDRIAQDWYPPIYNASSSGALGYSSPLERASVFISDAFFQCKNVYLDAVFDTVYASVFSVPPGLHAQDVAFNFYDHSQPDAAVGMFNESLALTMQDYIITFVKQGIPSSVENNSTKWEEYAKDRRVMNLGLQDIAMTSDPVNTARCRFWWNITG